MISINLRSSAQGDLLVTPKRLVFEGNLQKAELTLMNIGKDTATYSLSFRQYKMTEQGNLVLTDKQDSGQLVAEPYLRFFPREVILAPGEPQVIMMQCRKKPDMPSGEYRSHLWFRNEKDYKPLVKDKPTLDSSQLSVSVTAIFGITIPIIIRTGEVNANASLSNLKLEIEKDTIQFLKLDVNRSGNGSLNGKISVDYLTPEGNSYILGAMNVSVYTSTNRRNVSIKLNKMPVMTLKAGNLRVRYTSPDDAKYMVYAEAVLSLTEQPTIAQGATGEQGNNQKKE
jgi:hypothetical protein